MAGKPINVYQADSIALGPVSVPVDAIVNATVEGYNKTGVVLVGQSGRFKAPLMVDGKPVMFTVSLYIQREALDEQEAEKVEAAKVERDASKAQREAVEQDKREREIRRAVELTKQVTKEAVYDALGRRTAEEIAAAAKGFKY